MKDFLDQLAKKNLVAIPTETVYGLAGDATEDIAVAKIFSLKKRPNFNPLIIHVHSLEQAKCYGIFNEEAEALAKHFWYPSQNPYPLTLVLPLQKNTNLSKLALSGLKTIALRIPFHPITLKLLREYNKPLAAPSANISHQLSPTKSEHVRKNFPTLPILEGDQCIVGIESTIIDCSDTTTSILRHGLITKEKIEHILGKKITIAKSHTTIKAPGFLKKHYSPLTPLQLNAVDYQTSEALLGFGNMECTLNLSPSGDLSEAARNLFSFLHQLDQGQYKKIVIAPIPNTGIGIAINDKLNRAISKE